MSTTSLVSLIDFTEATARLRSHAIRLSEVPVEHAVSLALPTRRLGVPGYAQFAAPADRAPGQPPVQGPPDRWWCLAAEGGALVLYALTQVVPLSEAALMDADLTSPAPDMAELRARHAVLTTALSAVAVPFLVGETVGPGTRADVAHALEAAVPTALYSHYQALAPDFLSWLSVS